MRKYILFISFLFSTLLSGCFNFESQQKNNTRDTIMQEEISESSTLNIEEKTTYYKRHVQNDADLSEKSATKSLKDVGFWWADETPEKIYETIADAFVNKDSEMLKSFFCEKTKTEHDLDTELKSAFCVFDGDIVSYDNEFPYLWTSGSSIKDGYVTEHHSSVSIEEVKTDIGKVYEIWFYLQDINNGDETTVGIQYIEILEVIGWEEFEPLYTIGEFLE